jgi:hypothetical protein
VLIAVYRSGAETARTALRMWSVTTCGWEIMITCEPSTSVGVVMRLFLPVTRVLAMTPG